MSNLESVPAQLTATRLALHRLATYVIAPARFKVTGRFGLRAAPGGFGTPTFDGRHIRVEGRDLIDGTADGETSSPITSLAAAAAFLSTDVDAETAAEHDSPALGDIDAELDIDEASSRFLGTWFNMAFVALTEAANDAQSVDASEPQLWPGHFDPAIEMGDENHRASYGASPGDQHIEAPYLYVSVWWPDRLQLDLTDQRWNAPAFTGAVLRLEDFPAGAPSDVATAFFLETRNALDGTLLR